MGAHAIDVSVPQIPVKDRKGISRVCQEEIQVGFQGFFIPRKGFWNHSVVRRIVAFHGKRLLSRGIQGEDALGMDQAAHRAALEAGCEEGLSWAHPIGTSRVTLVRV
jgi:hypothetical protein